MATPKSHLQIAVLTHGFVYVGRCEIADGFLTISEAGNIRRWGTEKGLGQLAATGPTDKTKIDWGGTVRAPLSALIHLIDVAPSAFPEIPAQAA